MDHVGIDLHKRDSQICWLYETGEVREVRIRTTPERFEALFGGQAPAQILIEASTESEWVARHLERLGHVAVVVDPNYAPMYPRRRRRRRASRRPVATCQLTYPPSRRVDPIAGIGSVLGQRLAARRSSATIQSGVITGHRCRRSSG